MLKDLDSRAPLSECLHETSASSQNVIDEIRSTVVQTATRHKPNNDANVIQNSVWYRQYTNLAICTYLFQATRKRTGCAFLTSAGNDSARAFPSLRHTDRNQPPNVYFKKQHGCLENTIVTLAFAQDEGTMSSNHHCCKSLRPPKTHQGQLLQVIFSNDQIRVLSHSYSAQGQGRPATFKSCPGTIIRLKQVPVRFVMLMLGIKITTC